MRLCIKGNKINNAAFSTNTPHKKIKLIMQLSQEISLIKNKINNATFWKFFEVAQRLAAEPLHTPTIRVLGGGDYPYTHIPYYRIPYRRIVHQFEYKIYECGHTTLVCSIYSTTNLNIKMLILPYERHKF